MARRSLLPLLTFLAAHLVAPAQEPIDAGLNARLRAEALGHSQIMATLHQITDVHSPRLTASPSYKAAADWTAAQLKAWGLQNVHQEAWDFGHPGWSNDYCAAHVEAPWQGHLGVEVVSWTPSTPGEVHGSAWLLDLPEEPTQLELTAVLNRAASMVAGKLVLVGPVKELPVLNPQSQPPRQSDEALAKRFDPEAPASQSPFNRSSPPKRAGALEPRQVSAQVDAFLVAHRALARINDAGLRNGQIRAFNNRSYDLSKAVATVVMRHEDFGRIARVLQDGSPVRVALDVRNRSFPASTQGYNVVAEVPGSDLPGEVILLGAHLDAWHTATGATDNGASVAVMMEAGRLLMAAGVKPRRTIRLAFWDGEEHGLLGSQEYVKTHYGSFEAPTAEFGQVVAYINMDGGAGQIRGLSGFGSPATAKVLRELVAPFSDLGVKGAITNNRRPTRGGGPSTDVVSFSSVGLPAFGAVQDGLEYFDYTWHTNIDTLDRVPILDAQRSAAVLASVAYHLAQRSERLPFFTAAEMPAPAKP